MVESIKIVIVIERFTHIDGNWSGIKLQVLEIKDRPLSCIFGSFPGLAQSPEDLTADPKICKF